MQPYTTHDFSLAAYLVLKGETLLGAVKTDSSGRYSFVFDSSETLERHEYEWEQRVGDAVLCKGFNRATKIVRDALKNPYQEGK